MDGMGFKSANRLSVPHTFARPPRRHATSAKPVVNPYIHFKGWNVSPSYSMPSPTVLILSYKEKISSSKVMARRIQHN